MVLVGGSAPSQWQESAFVHAVFARQLAADTPVSFDAGRSWIPAWTAAQGLHARGEAGLAAIVPVHVDGWAMAAGYAAVFSGLFFGGPIVFATTLMAFDTGPKLVVRLLAALVGALLGPLPIAALAALGFRNLRRDPTRRGRGRAIFALVVAALLMVPCLVGLVAALARG